MDPTIIDKAEFFLKRAKQNHGLNDDAAMRLWRELVHTLILGVPLDELSKAEAPPKSDFIWHTVVNGDTLANLATKYKTSINAIKQINKLSGESIGNRNFLYIPKGIVEGHVTLQLDEAKKEKLIKQFMSQSGVATRGEAMLYLENANWDHGKAISQLMDDMEERSKARRNQ